MLNISLRSLKSARQRTITDAVAVLHHVIAHGLVAGVQRRLEDKEDVALVQYVHRQQCSLARKG